MLKVAPCMVSCMVIWSYGHMVIQSYSPTVPQSYSHTSKFFRLDGLLPFYIIMGLHSASSALSVEL